MRGHRRPGRSRALRQSAAVLFARKLLEETGTQTAKTLSAAAGRLVARMRGRGAENAEIGAAVTIVQADPSDEVRVQLLGRVLAARAEQDPRLGRELREQALVMRRLYDGDHPRIASSKTPDPGWAARP